MREKEPKPEPRIAHMRLVTNGFGQNLRQIRWAWERPVKAYEKVSVPVQLAVTFLGLVALCPLEEMLHDLAEDAMTTRRIAMAQTDDLRRDNPDGLTANLHRWRTAISTGRIELFASEEGRRLHGIRAWQPPTPDGDGSDAWSMTLDTERLSLIVTTLVDILPAWGNPPLRVTLPPVRLV